LCFFSVNLLFGVGSVIICYIFSGELDTIASKTGDITEVHLVALMYTIIVKSEDRNEAKIWAIVAYAGILLAGFISMVSLQLSTFAEFNVNFQATITYTLLKAITVQNRRRLKWWQTSIILCFVGLVLGAAVLLKSDFQIVRLLDHYIVGNLILISVIIEVFALIAFYGEHRRHFSFHHNKEIYFRHREYQIRF
jgi:hypothetical protein